MFEQWTVDVNETFAPTFESLLNTLSLNIFLRGILLMGFSLRRKNSPIYKIRLQNEEISGVKTNVKDTM